MLLTGCAATSHSHKDVLDRQMLMCRNNEQYNAVICIELYPDDLKDIPDALPVVPGKSGLSGGTGR